MLLCGLCCCVNLFFSLFYFVFLFLSVPSLLAAISARGSGNNGARAHAGMEGNVDKMRKDELMKYARSLGVDTRKRGRRKWRAVEEVRKDCKAREAAQQERSRAHAGEPGSASSGVAVRSASCGPALAQTLSADTVEPGSASSSQAQASQTAVDRHLHGARRRRPTPPHWAETFATAVNRHIHGATRRLAADGRQYTWEEFAIYHREDARAMWEAARQREVCMEIWSLWKSTLETRYTRACEREKAIWSQVVTRLEENLRRSRWRIIARKMRRFAGACLIYSYLRTNPRRVAPLFEDDWLAGRAPRLEPWEDYNWDANIALADFDAMPQDDHFGQDTPPCSTSAPGSASAAEPSLHSMD